MSNKHVYEAIFKATDEFKKDVETFDKISMGQFVELTNALTNGIRGLCMGAMEQLKETNPEKEDILKLLDGIKYKKEDNED